MEVCAQASTRLLEVADVATAYGKIEALRGVSLSAERGP
jgi:ABC-type histidine transport system ATPase subunit